MRERVFVFLTILGMLTLGVATARAEEIGNDPIGDIPLVPSEIDGYTDQVTLHIETQNFTISSPMLEARINGGSWFDASSYIIDSEGYYYDFDEDSAWEYTHQYLTIDLWYWYLWPGDLIDWRYTAKDVHTEAPLTRTGSTDVVWWLSSPSPRVYLGGPDHMTADTTIVGITPIGDRHDIWYYSVRARVNGGSWVTLTNDVTYVSWVLQNVDGWSDTDFFGALMEVDISALGTLETNDEVLFEFTSYDYWYDAESGYRLVTVE